MRTQPLARTEGRGHDGDALSVAIIGGGQAARKALLALQDSGAGINIAGVVCEPHELRDLIDDSRRAADAEELFSRAGFDAVYIATPVDTHVPLACRALRQGMAVIIEKPLALSIHDAEPLASFTRSLVTVAFKKRFSEAVQCVRQHLASLDFTSARFDWEIPAPPTPWRYARDSAGGGVVMDLGSHVLDLFEYLFGPIADVEARLPRNNGEVERTAELSVRFIAAGRAEASLSWGETHRQTFTIRGRGGEIALQRGGGQIDVVVDSRGSQPLQFPQHSEYVRMFAELANAFHGRPSEMPALATGVRNLRLIEAVYEAAATGSVVRV